MKRDEGKRIRACVKCGSGDVTSTPGDGFAFMEGTGLGPVGGMMLCRKCGNSGTPIEFADGKSYRAFLKSLKKKGRND